LRFGLVSVHDDIGEIQPDAKIVIEHVEKPWCRLTVTLTARGDQTHLAWVQEFENPDFAFPAWSFAAATVETAMANPLVIVRPQPHQTFLDGLALYKARPDKEYSLTDCIAMETVRQESITEVLTHDRHFTQEGFTILL
jgi:hypothetical protein